ncbi:MAG: putative drug exporter of the superfamily [Micromonosporaceae bacterium]
MRNSGPIVGVARWSARHRWAAVGGWLLFVTLAVVIGGAAGTRSLDTADTGAGESRLAEKAVAGAYFNDKPTESVLIQPRGAGGLSAAQAAAVGGELRQGYGTVGGIGSVADAVPSRDGHSWLVVVALDTGTRTGADRTTFAKSLVTPLLDATARVAARHPDLRVEQVGAASLNKAIGTQIAADLRRAELTSVPLTLLILLLAFGALLAAGVPVLLALTAVASALGLSSLASHLVPMDDSVSSVVLLIGMAVGVDYSLFYIRREREERARGHSSRDSIEIAAATSGRAVLVSGVTVLISMAGLFVAGNAVFSSVAVGTMLVVAVAMLGSVTVLPALLALLGDRIDRPRIPLLHRLRRPDRESRAWGLVLRGVLGRPGLCLALAAAALLALAVPALGMRLRPVTAQDLPRSVPILRTYDRLNAAFPDRGEAHTVVVTATGATPLPGARVTAAIGDLARQAGASGLFATAGRPVPRFSSDRRVAVVDLPIPYAASDPRAGRSLDLLRQLVPATLGQVPGTWTGVTGRVAGTRDFADHLAARLPWVFCFVLGLSFLVMLLTFRALGVALTAIALNLLSVAAAYGLLVLVFQGHWAERPLGFHSNGGLVSWLPLFLFVILFGLSMDYHVFLVSRIREGVAAGLSTRDAVRAGVTRSASTVTSAALVMVAVFAVFAMLSLLTFKQLGVGLATAILIDATVVRVVLLPASMALLGRYNWYLPSWLRWLPRVGYDLPAAAPAAARVPVLSGPRGGGTGC